MNSSQFTQINLKIDKLQDTFPCQLPLLTKMINQLLLPGLIYQLEITQLNKKIFLIEEQSESFLSKGPESKYFWLCKLNDLYHSYSICCRLKAASKGMGVAMFQYDYSQKQAQCQVWPMSYSLPILIIELCFGHILCFQILS